MQAIKTHRLASALLTALLLAGCGGGDDSPSSSPQTDPEPPVATNSPPTIQGQPGTSVLAGQSYSFQPTATDPDGDTLTFSATNLPSWLSVNASTGRLSGTPAAGDVGSYSGIRLTVSDGKATASLNAFNLTVAAVGSGSATVSWVAPTQNTDGSTLTDLAGYAILYGRSASDLSLSVSINNPSLSSYVVENLTSGAWFFAVVAINSNGTSSVPSDVATKTIG